MEGGIIKLHQFRHNVGPNYLALKSRGHRQPVTETLMAMFELSRSGFEAIENPNSARPKLTLGGNRNPAASCGSDRVDYHSSRGVLSHLRDAENQIPVDKVAYHAADIGIPHEAPTEPVRSPLPFALIHRQVATEVTAHGSPEERRKALDRWHTMIATAVMRTFPAGSPDRPAAKAFAYKTNKFAREPLCAATPLQSIVPPSVRAADTTASPIRPA